MNSVNEIDLKSVAVSLEALELISGSMARRLGILPLVIADNIFYVVADDPDDLGIADQLEDITGYEVRLLAAKANPDLYEVINEYYPDLQIKTSDDANQVQGVLAELLSRAVKMRASDIHIFPSENDASLQFRIDSKLIQARRLTSQEASEFISYVKVLAKMNIAEKRQPLDGSAEVKLANGKVNLRIATLPTIYGERMAIRILTDVVFNELSGLDTLGFDKKQLSMVESAMSLTQGMIYLSGPTGSGKTTTLYSIIKELQNDGTKHILTVEDPVENIIPGITQISVDSEGERVRFHKILRSVLRHDPDVILIGETRDDESANVALNSAMTGHLVLSTVHANNSVAVVERLMELGVERSLLASLLSISIAQRLLRRPCKYCAYQTELNDVQKARIGCENIKNLKITEAKGCVFCRNQGSSGRIGIFEILKLDAKSSYTLGNSAVSTHDLINQIKPERTLRDDALLKCHKGQVLFNEVLSLVGVKEGGA